MIAAAEPATAVTQRSKNLTGRDYLSVSAVKQYMRCPLSYRFRYIDGLTEDTVSSALAFGRGIHASLELWFTCQLEGRPEPNVDDLLVEFWLEWRSCSEDTEIRFGKNEDAVSLGELAKRILLAFINNPAARPDGTVIAIEEQLRSKLIDDAPEILGRIDLGLETEDAVVITDFKTSRSRWSIAQRMDSELQAVVYSELARPVAGDKPVRVEFLVLTKTKAPAIETVTFEPTPERTRRGLAMMSATWNAIESGQFFPTPSITACPSCAFRKQCSSWPD
jgi:putative RecB family exonuclease